LWLDFSRKREKYLTTFEKFGDQFQSKVIYHIVTDKLFALQVLEILEPEFFSNDSFVEISRQIIDWNEKYGTIPSFDNLNTIVKTKYEDDIERDYLLQLIEAIQKGINVTDKRFVIDETVQFCKQQAMKNAILKSVDLLKREQYNDIYTIVQQAMSAGQAKDIGHSFVESIMARTVAERHPIKTGFDMWDNNYFAGGLSAGELGIILGGTGAGKSFMLAQLAYAAFMQGKTSVFYSFELSEIPIGLRLDSKFTGIPLTKLLLDIDGKHRDRAKQAILTQQSKFESKPNIIIKEYPTKTASMSTLKNHLQHLQAKNIKPDLIIVDYADLMKPTTRYKDKRFELESIVENLRGWAGEEKIPIWTASQTNRDGLDTSVVTLKTISESLAKAMVADLIISIGRSPQLMEQGRACYYIAKSRLGRDKIAFTGEFDTSVMNFTVDEEGFDAETMINHQNQENINLAVRDILANPGGMVSRSSAISELLEGLDD